MSNLFDDRNPEAVKVLDLVINSLDVEIDLKTLSGCAKYSGLLDEIESVIGEGDPIDCADLPDFTYRDFTGAVK